MNFELSQEQLMFRNMARQFAQREFLPVLKNGEREEEINHRELIKKMAVMGLAGFNLPQEYGGLGLDYITWGIIWEELSRCSWSMASTCNSSILAGTIIMNAGTEEQKRKYLPAICRGEKIFAMAAVEPNAGSDAANIQTTALRSGDCWFVNGNKIFISNGGIADTVLVLVQTDKSKGPRGLTILAVDRGTPGFSSVDMRGKLGYRVANLAQLRFTDCAVPETNLIGEVGKGLANAMGGIDNARYSIAIGALGMSQGCLEACINYVKERYQFNRPLANFQLVQDKIATMAAQIDVMRNYLYRLGDLKNKGARHAKETSVAKYLASEMAVRISAKAVELFGAYGCIDDYPVEHHYRDAVVTTILGGTTNIHKLIIGRELLDKDATA